jgi:hypothetical protein
MAQQVLHVVAEDVEKQHIADQVHPAAMEEHGGHERVAVLPFQGLDRHQRPLVEERHQQALVARHGRVVAEEHHDVDGDERPGHERALRSEGL